MEHRRSRTAYVIESRRSSLRASRPRQCRADERGGKRQGTSLDEAVRPTCVAMVLQLAALCALSCGADASGSRTLEDGGSGGVGGDHSSRASAGGSALRDAGSGASAGGGAGAGATTAGGGTSAGGGAGTARSGSMTPLLDACFASIAAQCRRKLQCKF